MSISLEYILIGLLFVAALIYIVYPGLPNYLKERSDKKFLEKLNVVQMNDYLKMGTVGWEFDEQNKVSSFWFSDTLDPNRNLLSYRPGFDVSVNYFEVMQLNFHTIYTCDPLNLPQDQEEVQFLIRWLGNDKKLVIVEDHRWFQKKYQFVHYTIPR